METSQNFEKQKYFYFKNPSILSFDHRRRIHISLDAVYGRKKYLRVLDFADGMLIFVCPSCLLNSQYDSSLKVKFRKIGVKLQHQCVQL